MVAKDDNKIVVKDFNLWIEKNHILNNINICIKSAAVTTIFGPSGCGKSTFIRSINRMNDFIEGVRFEGSILIDGTDIYSDDIDVYSLRRDVTMVFQKPNPFPKSIFENVAYGLRVQGIRDKNVIQEKVEKALKDAWLWDEVKDRLHSSALTLSGGQQQRLCIARCLSVSPKVLLLDEPTSALDPISSAKIEELIIDLKNKVTVILVTHNIRQVARVSDYIAFIYLGEVVEYGRATDILTNPKHKLTEQYIRGKFG